MTAKEEITKLIMESYDRGVNDATKSVMETLNIAIKAAIRVEREACAKVCESLWRIDGQLTADEFAAEIRARSNT
jgi:hypothetical protein